MRPCRVSARLCGVIQSASWDRAYLSEAPRAVELRVAACVPFVRIQKQEDIMRKLILLVVAVAAALSAVVTTGSRSQASVIAPPSLREAADELLLTETVQFWWKGQRYCWYNTGWRGPGWYRCGFRSRRGLGWGGPSGWHGWRRPGHRPPARRPRPGRPGMHRPQPLPATRS